MGLASLGSLSRLVLFHILLDSEEMAILVHVEIFTQKATLAGNSISRCTYLSFSYDRFLLVIM